MSLPDEKPPAVDPAILCGQLQRELHRLRQGEFDPEEPLLYEAYTRQVIAFCWRRVAAGDLAAPGELIGRLDGIQSFVNVFLPEPGEPQAEAARLMHQLLVGLALAARALEPVRRQARLADRERSATEREVLRVLFEHRDRYLPRGEVHKRMKLQDRSPVRVGQILVDLHHQGLLVRVHGTARGNPSAAFYALSGAGVALCEELNLSNPEPAEQPPLFSLPSGIAESLLKSDRVAMPSRGFARADSEIATFYSYRGGLGRSLAVAQTGRLLAARHLEERFLLIDMDLEAPGLNEYFKVPRETTGFEGLLEGYDAQPREARRTWLAEAVRQPPYVVPVGGLRNLFLLPSASAAVTHRAGGAADRLQLAVDRARRGPDGRPTLSEDGFLADLRHVLHQAYTRVLIDAPAGLSPTSYASTVLLPDELVLCLRPNPSPLDSVRKVLASFLWRDRGERQRPLATFVFTPFPLDAREIRPDRWMEEHLLSDRPVPGRHNLRIVRLYQSKAVACGRDLLASDPGSLLLHGYEHLATLIGSAIVDPDLLSLIEREIARLAEADRSLRQNASHPASAPLAREPDVFACSSGGRAREAVAGLASLTRP